MRFTNSLQCPNIWCGGFGMAATPEVERKGWEVVKGSRAVRSVTNCHIGIGGQAPAVLRQRTRCAPAPLELLLATRHATHVGGEVAWDVCDYNAIRCSRLLPNWLL